MTKKKIAGFMITASAATEAAAATKAAAAKARPKAVSARPRAAAPSRKEVRAASFYDRAKASINDVIDEHDVLATIGACAAGHQLSKRVIDPAGRAVAGVVKGAMAKKVTSKVTEEVKGAFSLGDVAGGIAEAFGGLK